jgi:DNA polymerase III subunit gamma/tau
VVGVARRLAAIDPTRLGSGGLRLQLELALLESPGASAAPAVFAAPAPTVAAPTVALAPDRVAVAGTAPAPPPVVAIPAAAPAAAAAAPAPIPTASRKAPAAEPAPPRAPSPAPGPVAAPGAGGDLERLRNGWAEVISIIGSSPVIRPLILECRPIAVESNVVTLGFPEERSFLKEALERRRVQLEGGLGKFLGHPVGVRCVATNLELLAPLPSDVDEARILEEAHRIFSEDIVDVREVT